MSAVLKIIDEYFGKPTPRQTVMKLKLVSERTTAREIIKGRVSEEIKMLNGKIRAQDKARSFLIAVPVHPTEKLLNKSSAARMVAKLKPLQSMNVDAEIQKAVKAFTTNKFVMLFDDRQIEDLDTDITIMPDSELVFLRLTPLVGG